MKISLLALAGALCIVSSPAVAQLAPAPVQPAPNVIAGAPSSGAVLRVGTAVPLKMSEELTTKHKQVRVGQRFRMEVSEDVKVDGITVIPVGTPAVGEVTDVRNKGMWGKSGHIGARVLYLTVNGRQIRLTGSFDDKGHAGGVGAAAVSGLVFLPAGFFMTGTSAHLPIGFPVNAFVDEDVPLTFAASAPAPLSVPMSITTSSPPTQTAAPKATPVTVSTSPNQK
jgi:hypothetical protein